MRQMQIKNDTKNMQKGEVKNFDPNEPLVVKDKSGKAYVLSTEGESDIDAETLIKVAESNYLTRELNDLKKERMNIGIDMVEVEATLKTGLITAGRLKEVTYDDKTTSIEAGGIKNYNNLNKWAQQNKDLVVEVANGTVGVFKKQELEDVHQSEIFLESAEDDRVIGVPHTMATAGDKIYIINGRIMTGWSMYFSLTAIKSPEDYAKNVDLVYNVPYLYASLLLKAQLGLGAGYRIMFGSSDDEMIPEERFIDNLHFKVLKINRSKLMKTGFHLYSYGNSYWHLRRDSDGVPMKVTILQPERMKIFLDPMTTKILFYIYLPPIIGGTVLTPYPNLKDNPNLMHNMALTYPIPIVIRPEDIIHIKQNDFTEYPFGFSDVRPCMDPAQARLDINLLAPIIFKKYAKPFVHLKLRARGGEGFAPLNTNQINTKINDMVDQITSMEPGSDLVTTDRWEVNVLSAPTGKQDLLVLASDIDAQTFAVNGVPETYFKPKGSTDRMIAEQDKTFMGRLGGDRSLFVEAVEEKLIRQPIQIMIDKKKLLAVNKDEKILDDLDKWLLDKGSFMAEDPRYPEIEWEEVIKQDETQEIANAVVLLQSGIISVERAAKKIGEEPPDTGEDKELDALFDGLGGEQETESLLKGGLDIKKTQKGSGQIDKGVMKPKPPGGGGARGAVPGVKQPKEGR